MPFSHARDHNVLDHIRQSQNLVTDSQRITEWIRHVESFAPVSPSVENSCAPSTMGTGTVRWVHGTEYEASILERSSIDQPHEMTSLSERNHLLGPWIQTVPLPTVTEDMEERTSIPGTAHTASSIPGHSANYPQIAATDRSGQGSGAHHRQHGVMPSSVDVPTISPHQITRPQWCLDNALQFHQSRPVVNPVLSDMLPYPGHRWGAQDQDEIGTGGLNVHFPCSMVPATNPPVARMKLVRPFGGVLVVNPMIGNQFVSVVDVQRTVIAWMRWEHPHVQDEGVQLTAREMVRARDGVTKWVQVWVWKGLTRVTGEANMWRINL